MSNKTIYPEGIRVFEPHQNAPDFVKGQVLITVRDFITFCEQNTEYLTTYKDKSQLKLDLKEGEKGLYLSVNTFKPEKKAEMDLNPKGQDLPF